MQVTTNSQDGVLDISQYYPVFEAMQTHDLVLNLHGEMTFTSSDITEANAEAKFVPQLHSLHQKFPRLRIVLEHVTSREGLEAVKACGSNVKGTITAHHLWITSEDVERSNFNFCKPIAKVCDIDISCKLASCFRTFSFKASNKVHRLLRIRSHFYKLQSMALQISSSVSIHHLDYEIRLT